MPSSPPEQAMLLVVRRLAALLSLPGQKIGGDGRSGKTTRRATSSRTGIILLGLRKADGMCGNRATRYSVQRGPVPHRRNSSKQRVDHTLGLIQVDLVPTPGCGDVHRVGT